MQNTYCVAKDAAAPSYPSRCCPRWTVGCTAGSVGCCDPAQPWQRSISVSEGLGAPSTAAKRRSPGQWRADGTAFALVVSGEEPASKSLLSLSIDMSTGDVTSRTSVSGFLEHNPDGGSAREFLWDPTRRVFYYFDANFTAGGGARPQTGRPAYLVTVDPIRAEATTQVLNGAVDYPTGYAMGPGGTVLLATEAWNTAGTSVTGFHFYSVDPATATAKPLSANDRGTGEAGNPEYYAGYHRSASADGTHVFRLGYELVTKQTGQGLGETRLDGGSGRATSNWTASPAQQGHDFFMSIDRVDAVSSSPLSESFVSLAPNREARSRDLDVVVWSTDGKQYDVVASLHDAHPPRSIGDELLGYMATAAKNQTFAALVAQYGITAELDVWALAVADLAGRNATVLTLKPRGLAGVWSVAGLGL